MAVNNFIPNVWSETLLTNLDREYIGVKNCTREFEGDIQKKGDVVKIASIGAIDVFDYTKNTDMTAPQTIEGSATQLEISQSKAFNFQIDDVDRAQQTPKLMNAAMAEAAAALADQADRYVYSLWSEVPSANTLTVKSLSLDNLVDTLVAAREMLYKKNVGGNTELVLEVSPHIASFILLNRIYEKTTDVLEHGLLGDFLGCKIYVSGNIAVDSDGYEKCFLRTRRAIAFAEQLRGMEAYRPEKRFADAVKGLHLYGAKIVRPDEMVLLNMKPIA